MKHRSAIAATGHKFRTKNISKRVQKIVISPIKEMSILADLFQEKTGADIISFGQGIPYFDTPSLIKKGIKKALEQLDTAKYTLEPGITELRELITKDLGKRKRIENIEAKKEIMINTGCQETVACALASTIDEGNEVFGITLGRELKKRSLKWKVPEGLTGNFAIVVKIFVRTLEALRLGGGSRKAASKAAHALH